MPDSMMREVFRLSINTKVELNIFHECLWNILVKSVTRLSIGITVTLDAEINLECEFGHKA